MSLMVLYICGSSVQPLLLHNETNRRHARLVGGVRSDQDTGGVISLV